jgi:peptidoglycan/LPS O-acetylase OafA/YrhL
MTAGRWAIALLSVLGFWHNQLMQDWGYFHYILNVYWSLSVEEVFYLGFAVLCLALGRGERVMMVAVALVLLGPLYRAVHPDDEIRYLYAYPACFDAIAWGVLAAWVAHRHPAAPARAVGPWVWPASRRPGAWISAPTRPGASRRWRPPPRCGSGPWPAAGPATRVGPAAGALGLAGAAQLRALPLPHHRAGAAAQVWSRQTLPDAGRLPLLAAYLALSAVVAWAVARGVGDPARRAWRRRWGRGEGPGERVTIAPP